jgi:hypothetical protein
MESRIGYIEEKSCCNHALAWVLKHVAMRCRNQTAPGGGIKSGSVRDKRHLNGDTYELHSLVEVIQIN